MGRATQLVLILAAAAVSACTQDSPPLVPTDRASSVRVVVAEGDRGAPDARLPFTVDAREVAMTIEVLGPDGNRLSSFDGYLELRIEPGDILSVTGAAGSIGPFVHVTGGYADDVRIRVAKAFSDARIWAEDAGYVPADPATAACSNGLDDDGDGLTDLPLDTGCRFENDDSEQPGSHAIGVSEVLFFANPSLADVQGRTGVSPLAGRRAVVDTGEMIVTRITTDGFYVSEIEHDSEGLPNGRAVPWGSAFIFNFNTPPFLRACDQILRVSGSIVEFFGFTEVNQPSWRRERWCQPPTPEEPNPPPCTGINGRTLEPRTCPIPEPFILDGTILGTENMEQYESALVRLENVTIAGRLSPEFPPLGSNCDLNRDGDVDTASTTPEGACLDACDADPDCSEWNTFVGFGQFVVRTGGKVMNVVTQDSVPDFDVLARRGQTLGALTGTVRNFSPLGTERGYILEPRCQNDITEEGETPLPASAACVTPRTGGIIEPE